MLIPSRSKHETNALLWLPGLPLPWFSFVTHFDASHDWAKLLPLLPGVLFITVANELVTKILVFPIITAIVIITRANLMKDLELITKIKR